MSDPLANILVVEDDPEVGKLVQNTLTEAGYACELINDGLLGLQRALANPFALLIVDVNLPSLNGLDFCRELKRVAPDVPLILLTARIDEVDVVSGLEVGADDYIPKPFRPRELLARVRARLRDSTRKLLRGSDAPPVEPQAGQQITVSGFVIDFEDFSVRKDGVLLKLTPKEFELLALLAARPGRAFTREEILETIWDTAVDQYSQSITTFVSRLRKKIGDDSVHPRFLVTVPGIGYKFAKPE